MQTSQPWTRHLAPGPQQQLVMSNAFKAAALYGFTFVIAMVRFAYCSQAEARASRAAGSGQRGMVMDDDGLGGSHAETFSSFPTASSVGEDDSSNGAPVKKRHV